MASERRSVAGAAPGISQLPFAPRRRLRVLCLHGWRTNAELLGVQLAPIRGQLGEDAELVFAEGHRRSSLPSDEAVGVLSSPPYFEWWRETVAADGTVSYHFEDGLLQSIIDMKRLIERDGPFDVLLGFSQGATLCALMSALLLQREVADATSPLLATMPDLSGLPPWRAVVLMCGVFPESALIPNFERHRMPMAALHVLGKQDVHYPSGRKLVDCFVGDSGHIFEHDGGHEAGTDPRRTAALVRKLHATVGTREH